MENKQTKEKPTLTIYNVKENKGIKSIDLREKLISVMLGLGWSFDSYGHLSRIVGETKERLKLSTNSFRHEKRNTEARSKWYNQGNGCYYYKQVNIFNDSYFQVMKPKRKKSVKKPRKVDSDILAMSEGKGYILEHVSRGTMKTFTEKEFKEGLLAEIIKVLKLNDSQVKEILQNLDEGNSYKLNEEISLRLEKDSNKLMANIVLRNHPLFN